MTASSDGSCGEPGELYTDTARSSQPPPVLCWTCREKLCCKQFSLFSQTVLHGTKLDPPRLLALLLNFVEAKDSISASEIARQYGIDHKSAYVLLLKVRQALYQSLLEAPPLAGEVQADAAYFCKYRRPGNVGNGASRNGKAAKKNAGLTDNGRLRR